MLHTTLPIIVRMTTSFKNIVKPNNITFDISIWICNRISDTRLSCKINYNCRLEFFLPN